LKQQRQNPVASSAAMASISWAFVEAIEMYAKVHQVPVLTFEKGQRKDDVVAPYLKQAAGQEGIMLIGKAQEKIEALARKWQVRLPQPFTAAERAAGSDYEISILQAEFALTQVLYRPLIGRLFFEAAIRENLDLGREQQVQLIFERRIIRSTPSRHVSTQTG
jgi:hypothetical protein